MSDPKPDELWISRPRIGEVLVAAARRARKPLTAETLAIFAGFRDRVRPELLAEVLDDLVGAKRLLRDNQANPRALWERIVTYRAPEV